MKIFTIGFTKTTAQNFFERLKNSGAKKIIDVRLNNVSQLAGFAKRDDLAYFLKTIGGIEYIHRPEYAPTPEILDAYRKKEMGWVEFETRFLQLAVERRIENILDSDMLDNACLLCSEADASQCHRRLVAEYLRDHIENITICHL